MTQSTDQALTDFCKSVNLIHVKQAAVLSDAVLEGDPAKIKAANEALRETLMSEMENHADPAIADAIGRACEIHGSDDVEVDGVPLVSVGEDGTWVLAWVHVRHVGGEDDQEDEG